MCSDQPGEMHRVDGGGQLLATWAPGLLPQHLQIAFVPRPRPFCFPSSQGEGKVGGTGAGESTYSFFMGVFVHTQELFNTESLSLGSDKTVPYFPPI